MPEVTEVKPLTGEPGKTGSTAEMICQMGKRKVVMKETIEAEEMPRRFASIYEAKGVWNRTDSTFDEINANSTRWTMHNDFRMSGGMKFFGWLMPGVFKKQTLKTMQRLKNLAEAEARK